MRPLPLAQALRESLANGSLLVAPGVYDAYTARIVESLGFHALYLGGNALGLHLGVGQPFVTLTETVEVVHRIGRGSSVPLIVDAGAGFGDAAHAAGAMNALAHAGAAAVHIDDQIYPKRAHYHRGRGRLADPRETAGKLRAMREAQPGGPVLIARTDALRTSGSLDAALERCARFAEAGAEAVMVLDLGLEGAAAIAKSLSVPLVWIGGIAEPVPTAAQLEAAGFALALYPFNTIGAVTNAVTTTWRGFSANGCPAVPARPSSQTAAAALGLIGMDTAWRIERATTEPEPFAGPD